MMSTGSLPNLVQLLEITLVVSNHDRAKLRGGFQGGRIVKRTRAPGLWRINRIARGLQLAG